MKNEKKCVVCSVDISYKKSNSASKCDKCIRILTDKARSAIINHQKNSKGRESVLMAYKVRCAICKWCLTDEEVSFVLKTKKKRIRQRGCELHHIIPVRDGGSGEFDNLILLCPICHKKADLGIISKEKLKSLIPNDMQEAIDKQRLSGISGEELLDSLF